MSEIKGRDLEYLLFNKKDYIGRFCVQIACGEGFDKIMDVGQITSLSGNDVFFMMKVDDNAWMMYCWDIILPDCHEDETSFVAHDKVSGVKFVILKKK